MLTSSTVPDRLLARHVLQMEAAAISALIDRVDDSFDAAVRILYECQGRVIASGVGKSGIIARKIAATLASTGTPAFFLHPTDAAHGDIGALRAGDVLIALSASGESQELLLLVRAARLAGAQVIGLTGNLTSALARTADAAVDCHVAEEACPFNLVPTASSTATLALGDALCITLLVAKGFTVSDFAVLHPAGKLGRQVGSIYQFMHTGEDVPRVLPDTLMWDVIQEMSCKRLGMTCVVDAHERLVGVITDGDLRRLVSRVPQVLDLLAADAMTTHPVVAGPSMLGSEAVALMELHRISALIVVSDEDTVLGVVQMRDLC